jgi:anti-sigma factor RsiW
MNCAEIHEKVVLAAYGELPDDQNHAMTLHLMSCKECREEQEQLLALKTLSAAYPVLEPSPNLVARSRTRLEESLDALPPKRWYDRLAGWMTRTATGLQSAPAAACLLLVAGAGLGSMGGYEFAQRHASQVDQKTETAGQSAGRTDAPAIPVTPAGLVSPTEVGAISGVSREPNSNLVEVSYNQVEPRRVKGTLENPQIRQLLMLASQNGASAGVRDDSVGLLAAACRSGQGCVGNGLQSTDFRDALMVSLRYDRSATVRLKALEGLQPFVGEDMQVRDAVLEALQNDPEARVRSAAISMLEPVEADTSVRQVLSTVALSDQNSNIRTASRVVLRRVSAVQ